MPSYLFLFTIGPVQRFIDQSRKAHDMYAGSALLCDMIQVAKAEIKTINNTVVFQFPSENSGLNRFLAKIDIDSIDFQIVGAQVENAVRDYFKSQALCAYKAINPKATCLPPKWQQQIDSHLEIYWAFQPIENNNYVDAYKAIEQTIGALKNTQLYCRTPETGRKCGLDGINNVVVYRKLTSSEVVDKKLHIPIANLNIVDKIAHQYKHISKGEGLGAVGFTKRMYKSSETFKSTIEVAYHDFIFKIEKIKLENLNSLSNNNLQILDKDNLTEDFFTKNDLDNLNKIKPIIEKIHKGSGATYSDYYALIKFDGDNMGEWLSGSNCKYGVDLSVFHPALAEKLQTFAATARHLVNCVGGSTIYAGGDDFLGMLPLHKVLPTLQLLHNEFREQVSNQLNAYKHPNFHITFSCGIAITHYKSPLQEALRLVNEMEHHAKMYSDKKAFAIGIQRHSGSLTRVRLPFEIGNVFTLKTTIDVINAISEDFSATLFKNFDEEIKKLNDLDSEVLKEFLNYAVPRAYKGNINEKKAKAKVEAMKTVLIATLIIIDSFDGENKVQKYRDYLNTCDFIKRQCK